MSTKRKDILTLKTEELEALAKESQDAVSLVTQTIDRMRSVGQRMQNNIKDIDEYCNSLTAVRNQLTKDYEHNEAVISNFSKLLCIDN